MAAILNTVLPLFALILLGYVLVGRKLLGPTTVGGLNAFVFYVSLPVLLFEKVRNAPFDALVDPRFLLAYYVPTLALLFATMAVSCWIWRTGRGPAMIQAICGVFPNSGYLGIPLLLTVGGPAAALPAILVLTFDSLITSPIAISVLESQRGTGAGWFRTLRKVVASLVRHPLIIAVALGLAFGQIGIEMPVAGQNLIDLLAGATVACALFALGGSLVGVPVSSDRTEVAVLSLLKVVMHPALVAFFVFVAIPLDPVTAMATVVVAALPAGATVFVLAERYQTHVQRASTVVLVTHALALITLPVLLAVLATNR